ncbi:MAG TPA: tetratricopeptide repeat protein [Polyangia bacterium]|nr:tetratricopeptide repeat protein [Polyangia bacterium]
MLVGTAGCMSVFQGRKLRAEVAELQGRLQARPAVDRGAEIAELSRALAQAEARWSAKDAAATAAARLDAQVTALAARTAELAETLRRQDQARQAAGARFDQRLAALEQSDAAIADRIGLFLPDDKDELWRQATALLASGERERGRRYAQAFVDRFPQDPRAAEGYLAIGRSYLEEARYSNAVAVFQRLLALHPPAPAAPEAMWQLSHAFEELSFCSDARTLLRTLVGRYPKSPEAVDAAKELHATKRQPGQCVS